MVVEGLSGYGEILARSEDYVFQRLCGYARESRLTSASAQEPSLRAAVHELAVALRESLAADAATPDAAFGVRTAQQHRAHGTHLVELLRLTKLERQAFVDLAREAPVGESGRGAALEATHLFFDGLELGFSAEWFRQREKEPATELQAELLRAQKLEALGQLAGGIAHDFNDILAAMIMQLNMLRLQPEVSPDELGHAVDDLLASANRAATLTRQLLLFSRRRAMKVARFDLNVMILELVKLLEHVLGQQIVLDLDCCAEPTWIEGDSGMVEQVVINLCVNARDAMPAGGRLTVATRVVELDAQATQSHGGVRPGPFACLQIEDMGMGMDAAVLEHIFEPYFTTKERGRGNGLGLATLHGIVAKHGGFVDVKSEVGQGSTFSVYLPSAPRTDAAKEPRAPVPARGGRERVLIVDDEVYLRQMTGRSLRLLGYGVREAANGADALAIWDQEQGAFDLVFTDMVMPGGISGLELCTRLRELKPGLRTIIASGYSSDVVDDDEMTFLSKPYDIPTLAATVRLCLDRKL